MHSKRYDPELPVFGNKVIAMYDGILDMHGVPREPTWTELETTVLPGAKSIQLIREVDWKVGESIIIAPTGYYNDEAEERVIVSINRTNPKKPILTLNETLKFKHYSGIQYFGDQK
jgi:G8 domain